jgi:hypothetical protein
MLKFGAPLMVAAAGWGRERKSVTSAAILIRKFIAVFS